MFRHGKQLVAVLLGAALLAGSLPLAAHADRDEKRSRERKREHREIRHRDRDRDHDRDHRRAEYHDRDRDHRRDHARHRDRDGCRPRVVVRDRVVYRPAWPSYSGFGWRFYASNLPPDRCDYWDPYCGERWGSLQEYRRHLRRARHAHVIHLLDDDGTTVYRYRDRGDDGWVRVAIGADIRF
jgi:hypothetical protein